jgi:ferredoxin
MSSVVNFCNVTWLGDELSVPVLSERHLGFEKAPYHKYLKLVTVQTSHCPNVSNQDECLYLGLCHVSCSEYLIYISSEATNVLNIKWLFSKALLTSV